MRATRCNLANSRRGTGEESANSRASTIEIVDKTPTTLRLTWWILPASRQKKILILPASH